jgi:hypothetical protein
MPIADSTLILEGQQDFSGGMNSSLSPTLIPENSVATAVNLTFRGGRPKSRPGFKQIGLQGGTPNGLNIFTSRLYQGSLFYAERRERFNPSIIGVFGGYVIQISLKDYKTNVLYPTIPAISASLVTGSTYIIDSIGTTDFTLIGASSNSVGLSFVKNSTAATGTGTVHIEQPSFNPSEKCYFVQAEKYLVIQNGLNPPVIWDGDKLYLSGDAPAGTAGAVSQLHTLGFGNIMAYGQGRLFVADPSRTQITAGDLAYGGSTNQVTITSGVHNTGKYRVTATAHGFVSNDIVTISGHSTEYGINGTWIITVVDANNFDINFSETLATGIGGFVTKANVGSDSDLLRFTETTYLSEGGSLQIPSFMGKITGMIFMPIQDTSTGQGDLLVFCEHGTATFSVAVPRSQWKSTQAFQRVLFQSIGATGHSSLVTTNGDVFFRAFDGLRSYRNARAELSTYGQVPMSAEMNSVLQYDTKPLLSEVSSIVFDNRLLFTASPKVDYSGISPVSPSKQPVTFSKIVALDFTTLSTVGGKRAASYDGMWAGIDVLQLITGIVNGKPTAWALAYDYVNGRLNVLWEITEKGAFDVPLGVESQKINSILETRAFSFGTLAEQKRMIRADFWLSDVQDRVDVKVYWRPDQYPCWREWHSFSRCGTVQNCITSGVSIYCQDGATVLQFSADSPPNFFYRLSRDGITTGPIQYSFNDSPVLHATELYNALIAAGFSVVQVVRTGAFPDFKFTIFTQPLPLWEQYTATNWDTLQASWEIPYINAGGATCDDFVFTPVHSGGSTVCLSNFTLKNLRPQYRPQIRMPTPPEDTDPIISRPYIYGNDFQLRLEFSGHFELNRILMLGQRILEQYQGTDTLEVL